MLNFSPYMNIFCFLRVNNFRVILFKERHSSSDSLFFPRYRKSLLFLVYYKYNSFFMRQLQYNHFLHA
uniref:Uncharacterized protein n=1 Tax=Ciona intestinalis TaxID=7719 RepID=H2XX40_CIOIN